MFEQIEEHANHQTLKMSLRVSSDYIHRLWCESKILKVLGWHLL